jgi:predicted MFS family arabinose efflux permease
MGKPLLVFCLQDRAHMELGIDPQTASNILGVIGMASMGGRLVFGFAADRVCFNRLWLYAGCVFFCGLGMSNQHSQDVQ